VISSSPTSMSSFVATSSFQNRTCTKTPIQVEVHEITFRTRYHSHETGSEQKSYTYFTPAMQSVEDWFQTTQHSMFLPYLLVRVFKINDSWCIGKEIWRSFWILTFLPLYISEHTLFPPKPCRWLMTLIAIGQELIGALRHACKTNQMHILPLGWWSGVETIENKRNASLRS
jgi:hypothetical protein